MKINWRRTPDGLVWSGLGLVFHIHFVGVGTGNSFDPWSYRAEGLPEEVTGVHSLRSTGVAETLQTCVDHCENSLLECAINSSVNGNASGGKMGSYTPGVGRELDSFLTSR